LAVADSLQAAVVLAGAARRADGDGGGAVTKILASFVLACAVVSSVAVAADFAIPPAPTHFVTDNADAMSAGARDALDSRLRDYEATTHHQVIVWIGDTTGDVPLETWTGETASHWKVGQKKYDDGAVLFLFMRDHKVRIEVGYGLEGSLTDADASRIIRDDIVPKMRSNDVDGAVTSGVAAMLTTITPSYAGVTPPPTSVANTPLSSGAIIALTFGLIFFVFFVIVAVTRLSVGAGKHGHWISSSGSSSSGGGFFSSSSSSSDDFSSGGGDFDAGGGDFGGGGASGSW
jgi:uncharacterized protein